MHALGALYTRLDTIENFFHKKILQPMAFTTMVAASFSCLFQIVYRFILSKFVNFTFPYTDEFTRYALVVTVWLIIPVIMKQGLHPSVDILRNKLGTKGKKVLYFIIKAITLFCLVIFLYHLISVIQSNANYYSPIMKVWGPLIYSVPTFGTVTMFIQLVVEVLGVISGKLLPFEYQENQEDLEEDIEI